MNPLDHSQSASGLREFNQQIYQFVDNLYRMRFLRIFPYLLLIFVILELNGNEPITSSESGLDEEIPDYAIKQVLVWRGDITGVYEDKQFIKVRIRRNFQLPGGTKSQEEFRNEILSQSWKIFYKESKDPIGEFKPTDLVWEKKSQKPDKPNQEWEAKLWGQVQLLDGIPDKRLQIHCFIAKYKEEFSYLEPHSFFGKKGTSLPRRLLHPKDGKEMLLVDRGVFLYGQGINSQEPSFHPEYFRPNLGNLVELEPYYIDKYEVTNKEYARYIRETNSRPPRHWRDGIYPDGEGDHPVDYLSYDEVKGYANWVGKRIPTEWEWEKAARGAGVEIYQNKDETLGYYINARPYPYGTSFDPGYCNTKESGMGKTLSIYQIPQNGSSPYGVIGMCGNVAEWTSSWYDKYPGQPYDLRGYGKVYRVIRGGSFRDGSLEARVFHRSYGGIPNLREDRKAGFRLVKDAR